MSALCNKIHGYGQTMSELYKLHLALMGAAIVPATIFVALNGFNYFIWIAGFIVAFAHAGILGVPVFLYARRRGLLNWWFSAIGGFAVGFIPYFTCFILPIIITNPHFAFFIWKELLPVLGLCGGLGASGGLAAWLVWHWLNCETKG